MSYIVVHAVTDLGESYWSIADAIVPTPIPVAARFISRQEAQDMADLMNTQKAERSWL